MNPNMTDLELLQQKYNALFFTVKRLRHWQREVDRYNLEGDKQIIKLLNREIDGLIRKEVEAAKNKGG